MSCSHETRRACHRRAAGIGRATCAALAARGFDVVGADLEAEGAAETEAAVAAAGGAFRFLAADVAATAAHGALVDAAWAAFGGLECLVNNAGVGALARGDLLDVSEASFDRCLGVNARGAFFLAQAVARRMLSADAPARGKRSLLFVSSANAFMPAVERGEYCVSRLPPRWPPSCSRYGSPMPESPCTRSGRA